MANFESNNEETELLKAKLKELETENLKLKKVQKTNKRFLNAIEEMHEGLQLIDKDWRYIYLNEAAARQGQSEKKELIGRTMMECYPGIEETEMFSILKMTMEDKQSRRIENKFKFPNGNQGWFELLVEAHSEGVLIRSLDITERKQLEEKYLHAQKMEAIGLLAGGIAHDFNNKLGIMTIYCGLLDNVTKQADPLIKRYIERIRKAVEQSASLTRQLLAFSRKQVLEMKIVDLNELTGNIKESLDKVLGENINIKVKFSRELYPVKVDASQIDQVILNLCLNARDAMPEGGDLVIETFNQHFDEEYCKSHPDVTPGDYAVLAISDSGTGMDKETLARVFEPFFTTKDVNKGTGLGLSTVYGIVKQCGGHIWVYSEVSHGTTFKLYFPRLRNQSTEPLSLPSEGTTQFLGHETILLVEDDPMLCEAVEASLIAVGYTVFSARNIEDARTMFNEHRDQISLLITDIVLEKSNGHALAQSLIAVNSSLKVLFISGYTENSISHQGVLKDNCVLLQKPFTGADLQKVVRQILDEKIKQGVF